MDLEIEESGWLIQFSFIRVMNTSSYCRHSLLTNCHFLTLISESKNQEEPRHGTGSFFLAGLLSDLKVMFKLLGEVKSGVNFELQLVTNLARCSPLCNSGMCVMAISNYFLIGFKVLSLK